MTGDVPSDERDRSAMRRALELAARGLATTHPNPRVGCVIVKAGRTLGEGWHERAGEPHAEVMALCAAREAARESGATEAGAAAAVSGATAYVTLEPCSHQGRTPPCASALIEAGIARVVFAMEDPNPKVSGQGAELLRRAGVRVDSGLLADEAAELNAGFIRRMTAGRPWVRVKLAQSLDGRTALASGASRWITGEEARRDVQRWRARSSAVLTGIGTVLADDPRLDVRETPYASELGDNRSAADPAAARVRQPYRIVLDSALRTPPGAHVFDAPGEVWIFTRSDDAARRKALEARGARVERVPDAEQAAGAGRAAGAAQAVTTEQAVSSARAPGAAPARIGVELRWVLARLARAEMNEVHVEAGPTLAGALLREHLVDELLLYLAPTLLGPQARALVALPELTQLSSAPRFEIVETRRVGADLSIRLRPRAPAAAP